jgi:hypothetical protein
MTREVYVSNTATGTITVYDAAASGDATPVRTLRGARGQKFWGLALDEVHGEMFVAGIDERSVHVFPIDATGEVRPVRSILLPNLRGPRDMALDLEHDELWIGGVFEPDGYNAVVAIPRASRGPVAPLRVVAGDRTKFGYVLGLAYDRARGAIAAGHGHCVAFFPRLANGDVAPIFTLEVPGGDGYYLSGGLTFVP